tara:strand:+ start:2238 stop:3470 length:1233 start_codon:yes stop_codon:yes gene_type:complete
MPNPFEFEYGGINPPSTNDMWNTWSQGSLADDWSYNPVTSPGGYDQYGVPNQEPVYDDDGNLIPTGFQQFMPEGMSFSDYMNFGGEGGVADLMDNEGQQTYDWYSYSSPNDPLSNLTQEELGLLMGEYGYEYLNNMPEDVQAHVAEAGGIAALSQLFADQYGSNFATWSDTSLNLEADIYAAQEGSMWAAYSDWELSQMGILSQELDQLGTSYLTNQNNQERQYRNSVISSREQEENYMRSQTTAADQMRRRMGGSGLGGGRLSQLADSSIEDVYDNIANIKAQQGFATRAYQTSTQNAADLYQSSASNLVTGFQTSQTNQLAGIEDSLESLVSNFELSASQAYEGWYMDLLDQVSDLDLFSPDIEVGDDTFEWSPFGVGLGNEDAVGYDAYVCEEGQHYDHTINDCVQD